MPWLLNAMWKIIKTWLPPKSIQKIKFVDKKSVGEYVAPDQCLTGWGGTDSYQYHFEPEVTSSPSGGTVPNGDITDNRKVHFAEGSAPSSPLRGKTVSRRTTPSTGGECGEKQRGKEGGDGCVCMSTLTPGEELVFSSCRIGVTASIVLTNPTANPLAIKIKTTSPEKYRVKPSVGVLEGEGQLEVRGDGGGAAGTLSTGERQVSGDGGSSSLPRPKLPGSTVNKEDLFEARLRVGVAAEDTNTSSLASPATPSATLPPELISKLDQLLQRQSAMEDQLRSARRIVFLLLAMLIAVLVFLVIATNNMTSTLLMHSTALHQGGRSGHRGEL
ncbi:hypothetical protein O3P69_009532 [Scylla paramamosain]|uniref:Motile sperm domain-containing protein 2 n=1 Tax=Scylla paramamosain TaxID=85552 RepID=A0AAW0SVE5_SCYPA